MTHRRLYSAVTVCLSIVAAISGVHSQALAASDYLSPEAVVADADAGVLYVADVTAQRIVPINLDKDKVGKPISVPAAPTGLALAPDGKTLYVTAGGVCVIDTASKKITATLAVGYGANAPVVSPDGTKLYVCNQFDNSVSVIDLVTGNTTATIPVDREPVAAAITPDGKRLFVANLLPVSRADIDYVAASVSVIDTAEKKVCGSITLPNGSTSLRGVCVSPDGQYVYVTHILGRYQLPTTQLERGWVNTNALSVIDAAGAKLVNTVLLDDVDQGAANPWGVACTADGKTIAVAHAGTHEVSLVDTAGLHAKLAKAAAGEQATSVSSSAEDVPNDLSFLVDIRRRVSLTGQGPRGVATVGTQLYAAEYFSGGIGVVDAAADRPKARFVALGKQPEPSQERKGEMLFADAKICFQQWHSCISCHPDARADALNWDLLNDGMGNPKNTRSMLVAHETPPAMSMGVRDTAETAVRAGIKFILFMVRPEEDAEAIDAYLKALKPVPSPYLEDGKMSAAAARGEAVFKKADCARCHPGPLYTNLESVDVGTGAGLDKGRTFDTPTLVETWRTAPYFHDGRAVTILELLKDFNPGDVHGVTSGLSETELSDLAAYVLSL